MFRAAASLAMLLGFYVVALIQLVIVIAFAIWVGVETTAFIGAKIAIPLVIAVGATFVGVFKAMRTRSGAEHGLLVTPQAAPELWNTVHALATEVGTRMPDEIRLVPEVNAAVSEDAKLLGLIGGRRRLYLGMPLIQAYSVDQMRSIIAHELGHYSGRHTGLGVAAYRGRLAVEETVEQLGRFNPVGIVFRGYSRLYLLVDNAASRSQEREADRASVRVAGPAAAIEALKDLPAVSAAWGFYFSRYVAPGWEAGYAPDDLFGGFGQLVAARQEELAELRQQEPEEATSRWDTHPSLADRIAIMRAAPQQAHPVDGRPATVLLPSIQQAGVALQREVVEVGSRQVLPWPQFIAAATTAGLQRTSDRIFRSLTRLTGTSEPSLGALLDLVEAGRLGELAEEFFSNATRKEAAVKFSGPMDMMLTLAAIRSGKAFWQMSWTEPVKLVDADGADLDLEDIAKLAVNPETLGEARSRLAEMGVRVEAATVIEAKATGRGAEVIGAMANVKVDGIESDLVLLNRGFVVASAPKKSDKGEQRLEELVQMYTGEELAARFRFIPFEEAGGATITKRTPIRAELRLHDGTVVTMEERWSGDQLGKSRDTLVEILERIIRNTEE
ncbi:M48 family metallopeptidase [Winogradskya humida]|uniref:Peptidase M48 domain-containing protein n=1 Tax=Winogradskya humida TaxID=113566 RepID=A0ABQ3ZP78_9ACTN|nr:M48 family metallopeptidase [Actinoplanes humidus]GIE20366.1 hypothetical protein Ahu01nite_034680 [Actinoplanes humidus]